MTMEAGKPFVIKNPANAMMKELGEFCIRWLALPNNARLTGCEISAHIGDVPTITVTAFPCPPGDVVKD